MKKIALFIVLGLAVGLLIGYLVWGKHHHHNVFSECGTPICDNEKISLQKVTIDVVKRDILEYRDSCETDTLFGVYTEFPEIDHHFCQQGLSLKLIEGIEKKPKEANGIGVYIAQRGATRVNYIIFSSIDDSPFPPRDFIEDVYELKGTTIDLHRLPKHTVDGGDNKSSHRTCQRNCPGWVPIN